MAHTNLSRRKFLTTGCLGLAAAGAGLCGLSALLPAPQDLPVKLPSERLEGLASSKRILVVVASMFGSTAEIAEALAAVLADRGFSVDLRPAQEQPDARGYDAALVGSAVQYGKWLPEGIAFLRENQPALREMPVGLFCAHITSTDDSPASQQKRRAFLDEARTLAPPVSEAYFAGKFDRRGAAKLLPGVIARFVPTWDLRKWERIQAWAGEVFDFNAARPALPPVNYR